MQFHGSAVHDAVFGLLGAHPPHGPQEFKVALNSFLGSPSGHVLRDVIILEAEISPLHNVASGGQLLDGFELVGQSLVKVTLVSIFEIVD